MFPFKNVSSITLRILVLCCLLSGAAALAEGTKPVKLFLLGGQSNMEGCGKSSELPDAFRTPPGNVRIWDNKKCLWVALGKDSTAIARNELFGPEVAFAYRLSKIWPDHRIGIVKTAAGGTKLHTQWLPGKWMYQRFILNFSKAVHDLEQSNTDYEIAGMLWMQGESDSETTEMANAYEHNLTTLIEDVRNQTKQGNLPFVMGRISSSLLKKTPWVFDHARIVQTAQETVAAQDDQVFIVNTDELSTLKDNTHFDTRAQLKLGDAMADFMIQALQKNVFPGAAEDTPSLAQYFSWINNTNEGSTEAHSLANLDFFEWLHNEYGMVLDIYAFDAGNIDGPRYYGSMQTEKFKSQFPNGFDPLYQKAKAMGTRLGIWLGPDGFGDSPDTEQARIDMLVTLCRDYEFALFKIDAVCGQLRPEKQDAFIRALSACRQYSPDLILLNHRLKLGKAEPHATTFLWGGAETYIDVHMANWRRTGTHNRVQALARGLVPDLKRLTEDHGVCISSCVDYWDDDLVLQAFNRCLILAPEIYANPWFLRDDEFPKLARLYNLHRRYRDILSKGVTLSEEQYGPKAVSRGNSTTRLLTLRNLTWESTRHQVALDASIGLDTEKQVTVLQLHPTERVLGRFAQGDSVPVDVLPFRSCLILATADPLQELAVQGCDYQVVRDVPGKDGVVRLLGHPGSSVQVSLSAGVRSFTNARINGKNVDHLLQGKPVTVSFPGTPLNDSWHRHLGTPVECPVPADVEALYETTVFAADNDPLEMRSLRRSGPSSVPQVQTARRMFLDQDMIVTRGIRDKYLFDDDPDTVYNLGRRLGIDHERSIRLDLGRTTRVDSLEFVLPTDEEVSNSRVSEHHVVEVSTDLTHWTLAHFVQLANSVQITLPSTRPIRYLRTNFVPAKLTEIHAQAQGKPLERSGWRCSFLFRPYAAQPALKAWSHRFTLNEAPKDAYLCIALEGTHGKEGAYAALRVGNTIVGAPTRATSYPSNVWEYPVPRRDSHYTYFIPVTKEMVGKPIEAIVLGMDPDHLDFKPEVWLTANAPPLTSQDLVLGVQK